LIENKDKVKGMFVTHGHEDHIGAIPYILKQINMPVYGTKLTIGLIENKLREHNILDICNLNSVEDKQLVQLEYFKIEFISVTHSIADACAICINSPIGVILHTGDFKVDYTPIDGRRMDLESISKIGKKGVLLLLADRKKIEKKEHK
ncbi:MBL fold metallo-hydrolase, partial [Paraclostridium bifermentans]|uniref:MBL fold metallo-hydrolase n=1 Tax=Paraclostridium bifermentans TaxID=1490 RepID=UPI001D020563